MTSAETFIEKIRNEFPQKKVIVLGDLMVDEYVTGSVSRVSPEAPVCVLSYGERKRSAGGASNVAMNLRGLGASVAVAGTAGDDAKGTWLRNYFGTNMIDCAGVLAEVGRPTTVKTRFATKGQQLLRVDREDDRPISAETQKAILSYLEGALPGHDALVISDYRKGVLGSADFVRSVTALCSRSGTVCCIDSKSRNIGAFAGMDFVKPNNLELEAAVGIKIDGDESLEKAGRAYLEKSGAKALVVTRGARGISVFVPGEARQDFAARPHEVFDVTGAGDTVISTIALGLVSGLDLCDSVRLANLAASVAISRVGTAPVTGEELIRRVREEEAGQ